MTQQQYDMALHLLSQLEDAQNYGELEQFIQDQQADLHWLLNGLIWIKPSTAGAA